MRDIATLFSKENRFGAKQSDLVSGAALNICLDVHQAFEVLNTPAEQRVSILASTHAGRAPTQGLGGHAAQ